MIKRANIQWSAKTLTNQVNKGNVIFDNAIQRASVWKNDRDSLLIHSMITGYPIPAMYFMKNDEKYDSMDGKQRSLAVTRFINGEYRLCDNFPDISNEQGEEYDCSGMSYNELPEFAQDAIRDYSFTIYYFEDLTEEERDIMFQRLNGGKPLTAVELTRVKAKSLEKFQEMAKHELVNKSISEKAKLGYNDEQLCFQAWAICFAENVSFDTGTFRPIIENADVEWGEVAKINACFDLILKTYKDFDQDDKNERKVSKRFITRTHIVSLVRAAYEALEKEYDKEKYIAFAKKFFSGTKRASINDIYNDACGAGSARRDKVNKRITTILEALSAFMEEKEVI